MSKPVVLVDMDGVLAEFDTVIHERFGHLLNCTPETQTKRFLTDHCKTKKGAKEIRAAVDAAGWFEDLPVIDGAVAGLWALAEEADVWICTKPLEVNPTCRDAKGAWLRRHFGAEFERKLIITPDKSLVHGHVLLDDAPHPEWFVRAYWEPVVYPYTWNGEGSAWSECLRWSWKRDVTELVEIAERIRG